MLATGSMKTSVMQAVRAMGKQGALQAWHSWINPMRVPRGHDGRQTTSGGAGTLGGTQGENISVHKHARAYMHMHTGPRAPQACHSTVHATLCALVTDTSGHSTMHRSLATEAH